MDYQAHTPLLILLPSARARVLLLLLLLAAPSRQRSLPNSLRTHHPSVACQLDLDEATGVHLVGGAAGPGPGGAAKQAAGGGGAGTGAEHALPEGEHLGGAGDGFSSNSSEYDAPLPPGVHAGVCVCARGLGIRAFPGLAPGGVPGRVLRHGAVWWRPPACTVAGETKRLCTVCLETYVEGEKLRVLPCHHRCALPPPPLAQDACTPPPLASSHTGCSAPSPFPRARPPRRFHMACIDQWLSARRVCPMCKHDCSKPLPQLATAQSARGGSPQPESTTAAGQAAALPAGAVLPASLSARLAGVRRAFMSVSSGPVASRTAANAAAAAGANAGGGGALLAPVAGGLVLTLPADAGSGGGAGGNGSGGG